MAVVHAVTLSWAAIIVAGGAGRRLGGLDKPGLVVDGQTLLDRAVAACEAAAEIVVVGPRRPTRGRVRWTREEPPGTGPLAAVEAGLRALNPGPAVVAVLAADLPLITSTLVERLVVGLDSEPSAVGGLAAAGDDGRVQPLAAAYRRDSLAAALADIGDPRHRPVRELLARLTVAAVVDQAGAVDIDTPNDLARWQGNAAG